MTLHPLRIRLPLLALGILALIGGLWAGLLRLGWPLPLLTLSLPVAHGPLMVGGFLGTLIGIERAVASGRLWPYGNPLLTGAGGMLVMVGLAPVLGPLLITLGSLGLVIVFIGFMYRQPSHHLLIMALGVLLWLTGNVLWLRGWALAQVVPWWSGFLVFTIAGERLELNRLLRFTRQRQIVFFLSLALYVAGLILTLATLDAGIRLSGAGVCLLAGWLLRYDIARRTVRQPGQTRFIAVSLLLGYIWLTLHGLLGMMVGGVMAGPSYDALLHSFFIGFVLSMILGHAPIIFPAILALPTPMHTTFYAPLGVLHLSLLLRIVGDLSGWWLGRQWGGLWNGIAIVLFLGSLALAIQRSRHCT